MATKTMATSRAKLWEKHKQELNKKVKAVWDYWSKLKEVIDSGSYLEEFDSVEKFIENETAVSKRQAYHMINACEVRQSLCTIVHSENVPSKESHLREIGKAPEEDRAELVASVLEKCESEGREPTAKDFKSERKKVTAEIVEPEAEGEEYEDVEDESDSLAPAEVITDKVGREVPEGLKEKHGLSVAIAQLSRQIDPVVRELERLADLQGGEFLDAQGISIDLKRIKGAIKDSAYHTACPRCESEYDCQLCEGQDFLPIRHRGYLTKEEKELCS